MTGTASPEPAASGQRPPPVTGDLVIDAALGELTAVAPEDLDGLLSTGTSVEEQLRGRLRDLAG